MKPFLLLLVAAAPFAQADTVVADDVIVQNSLCAGTDCVEGEEFSYDTIKVKGTAPQVLLDDTSSSASFPSNDWRFGVFGEADAAPGAFFMQNATSGNQVLLLTTDGDVALGDSAEAVSGAVSVGATGNERRITFVADGVDDTDAVTLGQLNTYITGLDTTDVDDQITAIESRIDALTARIEALADELDR